MKTHKAINSIKWILLNWKKLLIWENLFCKKGFLKPFLKNFKLFVSTILLLIPLTPFTLSASKYDVIVQRDIFDEKRGANKKQTDDQLKAAGREQLSKYFLAGIIKIHNKIEGAYIKPSPDGKPDGSILLKKGDKLEGWTVDDIKDKKIILKNADQVYEILLWEPDKGPRKGAPRLGFVSTPHQFSAPVQPPPPQPTPQPQPPSPQAPPPPPPQEMQQPR